MKRGLRIRWHIAAAMAVVCVGALVAARPGSAQDVDFGRIDKFQSLGTGTLHVGEAPKTLVDDAEQHAVILTIYDADAQTKVYWQAPGSKESRSTIMPGRGIQTFQTFGVLKVEAVGEPYHEVKYGYVLLGLRQ